MQKINKLKVVCDEILNDKWKTKKGKAFKYDSGKGVFFRKIHKLDGKGSEKLVGGKANNFQDNITKLFQNEGVISANKKKSNRSKNRKNRRGAPSQIDYSDLQAIRKVEMREFANMDEHSIDSEDLMRPLYKRKVHDEDSSEECIFFLGNKF